MKRIAAVVAVLAIALVGCTEPPSVEKPDTDAVPVVAENYTSAEELFGSWIVEGAPGEPGPVDLLIQGSEYVLWGKCGLVVGDWGGYSHTVAFAVNNPHGKCRVKEGEPRTWLNSVTRYSGAGDEFTLLDGEGETVATLTRSPIEHDIEKYSKHFILPAPHEDHLERWFGEHAPLPSVATPVDSIVGEWHAAKGTGKAHASFTELGRAGGNDGCNGWSANFSTDERGNIVWAGGSQTLMACMDQKDSLHVLQAKTVGMVGDELTFFDDTGTVVASAVRAEP